MLLAPYTEMHNRDPGTVALGQRMKQEAPSAVVGFRHGYYGHTKTYTNIRREGICVVLPPLKYPPQTGLENSFRMFLLAANCPNMCWGRVR